MRLGARFAVWMLWFVVYGAAVQLGLSFYFDPESVATFWPASGLFMGLLVIRPYREWPWIVLLCAISQLGADYLASQRALGINASFALSNSLEPMTGALLVRRVFSGCPDFGRLRHVLGSGAIAVVAPVATATIGSAIVSQQFGANFFSTLQIWWAADALGMLAVVPVVVYFGTTDTWNPRTWTKPGLETIAILAVTGLTSFFVFGTPAGPALSVLDHPYIIYPPLIWAALRLNPREVATIGLSICLIVVFATDHGYGTFIRFGETTRERVLAVQAFLAVTLVSVSVLSAVMHERRESERRRDQLEAQLRQSQKMEAVGQLAGGIAHDFNNLLMVIQANLDLVALNLIPDHKDHEESQSLIAQANEATDRATMLTRQLLLFSRQAPPNRERINLNDVLFRIEPMLRRVIGEHIDLRFDASASLPSISADNGQMEQVIMNLVLNARDAMPNGGRVTISTANGGSGDGPSPNESGEVRMVVADDGPGIPDDIQPRLFDPFFTTKEVGKGTGLGLATVHSIVLTNDGSIAVQSKVGRGAAFVVCFPALQRESEAPIPRSLPTGDGHGSETILVCEDENAVRSVLRQALEDGGYDTLLARDGEDAIEKAKGAESIDLLVTDLVMPGMNGPELADRVTEICPQIRVLFISGYTSDVLARSGKEPGDIELLAKPFRATQLRHRVRQVLDKRAAI